MVRARTGDGRGRGLKETALARERPTKGRLLARAVAVGHLAPAAMLLN